MARADFADISRALSICVCAAFILVPSTNIAGMAIIISKTIHKKIDIAPSVFLKTSLRFYPPFP